MKLDSSNAPIFLPEKDQESVLRLGFENCAPEKWIYPAADLDRFHQHKTALFNSDKAQCAAAISGSEKAQHEMYDFLLHHLLHNPELGYRTNKQQLLHQQSALSWELKDRQLWQTSLWVAEDFCLLERKDNNYVMTAASVCSPSNWLLTEKIAQSVDFIHAPVPAYAEKLARRVNRFLDGLPSGKVMLRYNWSIQPGNELFWRDDLIPNTEKPDTAANNLYWRIERQTFIRLPESGAIVFAIRIFLHSFESMRNHAGFEQNLQQLLSNLPADEKRYKGLSETEKTR
jgi:dimethylamine monooxygenase subunit A